MGLPDIKFRPSMVQWKENPLFLEILRAITSDNLLLNKI